MSTWRKIKLWFILAVLLVFGIGYVVNCVVQDFFPEEEESENVGAPDSSGVSSPPSSARSTPTSERLPTMTGGKVYQTDDEIRVECGLSRRLWTATGAFA